MDLDDADAEAISKRRQETLQFQTDTSEVSFVNYRAIIDDREQRCQLQSRIDQEVKVMQQAVGYSLAQG